MKPTIRSIYNSEDSIWFQIELSDDAIYELYDLFGLDDYVEGEFVGTYLLDEHDYLAYLIILADVIHLILRKVRGYAKKRDEILNHFKFLNTGAPSAAQRI